MLRCPSTVSRAIRASIHHKRRPKLQHKLLACQAPSVFAFLEDENRSVGGPRLLPLLGEPRPLPDAASDAGRPHLDSGVLPLPLLTGERCGRDGLGTPFSFAAIAGGAGRVRLRMGGDRA